MTLLATNSSRAVRAAVAVPSVVVMMLSPELCTASRDAEVVRLEAENRHAYIEAIPAPNDTRYQLQQPIPVEFEEVEGAVVARFREASLAMTGYDRQDAEDALVDWILDMFEDLDAADPVTLGTVPTTQIRVLREYLRRS